MSTAFHKRFPPNKVPDTWRDWLHRAATRINEDEGMPCIFPQKSLDYLSELDQLLPKAGFVFLGRAHNFLEQLALAMLPADRSARVTEFGDLQRQKVEAVANGEFETACALREQQDRVKKILASLPVREITCDEIADGLVRYGIDPDVSRKRAAKMEVRGR